MSIPKVMPMAGSVLSSKAIMQSRCARSRIEIEMAAPVNDAKAATVEADEMPWAILMAYCGTRRPLFGIRMVKTNGGTDPAGQKVDGRSVSVSTAVSVRSTDASGTTVKLTYQLLLLLLMLLLLLLFVEDTKNCGVELKATHWELLHC